MQYLEMLVARIRNPINWPDFDRPYFLEELNAIADRSYDSNTVEGYLAALLIYHQLTEEMLRLLLEFCEFYVQVCLAPVEIHFPLPEKAMFGRLLATMQNSMEFENKAELLSLSQLINQDRITVVHLLTKQDSTEAVSEKVQRVRDRFEKFYDKFEETKDWFMLCLKDLHKDGEWEELLITK